MTDERTDQKSINLRTQLHRLITDPDFIKFHELVDEPNIFRIVGQKNYERWHSGFWAWLLDIDGTHGLGSYPLELFILHALTHDSVKPPNIESSIKAFLDSTIWNQRNIEEFRISPSERNNQEASVDIEGTNAFFDILLSGESKGTADDGLRQNTIKFALLVEMKVKANSTDGQATRYANWFEESYKRHRRLLIYVLPSHRMRESVEKTIGDPRWCIVTYQSLHDHVLSKILQHHNLAEHARWVIREYIKNLRTERKGSSMAITHEERELAVKIFKQYQTTFQALQDALHMEGQEELDLQPIPGATRRPPITVSVGGEKLTAPTFKKLAGLIVLQLQKMGRMDKMLMPWGLGNVRYFIVRVDSHDGTAEEPKHSNGSPFIQPEFVGSKPRYAIETNISREAGLEVFRRLCSELDVEWEIIQTS